MFLHKSRSYGQIETPLTTLLKKEAFSWTEEATKAFEKLKESMCTTLVLATLNSTNFFFVECDASSHEIGAVLMQEGRLPTFERNQLKRKKTYSNPFMKKKCLPYYMQFRNGDLT